MSEWIPVSDNKSIEPNYYIVAYDHDGTLGTCEAYWDYDWGWLYPVWDDSGKENYEKPIVQYYRPFPKHPMIDLPADTCR